METNVEINPATGPRTVTVTITSEGPFEWVIKRDADGNFTNGCLSSTGKITHDMVYDDGSNADDTEYDADSEDSYDGIEMAMSSMVRPVTKVKRKVFVIRDKDGDVLKKITWITKEVAGAPPVVTRIKDEYIEKVQSEAETETETDTEYEAEIETETEAETEDETESDNDDGSESEGESSDNKTSSSDSSGDIDQ